MTKVPIFAELEKEQFARVIPLLRKRSFPRGETIINQGDRSDSLYMIARGLVSVFDEERGEELCQLYAGDFFGEAALLHETPRNASVRAISPCSLYQLQRDDWLQLCALHPDIRRTVEAVDSARGGGKLPDAAR